MNINPQSGLSTLQVIIVVTVLVFSVGLITLVASGTIGESVTQNSAETVPETSPLADLAQNIAENQAEPVTQAVDERNDQISAEIAVDAAATASPAPEKTLTGTFESYSPDKLALANTGTVVLFFHADWCPSCRSLEDDLNAKLGAIPENIHILKLDYDTETELKQTYGVIRQHTLVVVDADGAEVKKLTGLTNTLDQVVNQL